MLRVMRKVRGLWPVGVILVIIIILGVWMWKIWRSAQRTDLATFWALHVAIIAVATPLIIYLAKKTRQPGDSGSSRTLDDIADRLAAAVKDQWTRAAAERRLLQPEPIPVQRRRASGPVAGPVSAAASSRQFRPLPGLKAVRQGQLREGGLPDLHAIYGGLGSGRMVIVGAPGSGKTGAAVLLILAALTHREQVPEKDRPQVPVPVMFTMHGWDPNNQPVQDWLIAQLCETYPLLAGKDGAADANALVRARKVAVILDGLDEIAEELRPVALRALSEQAVFRLVVLARNAEMAAAAQTALLDGAVSLELQDVDPSASADYLERVQRDPAPAGWCELTDRLRRAPDSPIAKALSNPLTLTLVRDTYRQSDNVRELLDFCDAGDGISRDDIEDHLLDRVLPTAYNPRPGEAPHAYELQAAQCGLGYIAVRMNQDGTRDLAWWRIPRWASGVRRVFATVLVAGLVGGLLGGLLVGFPVGLAFERRGRSPKRIAHPKWGRLFSSSWLRRGLVAGFVAMLVAVSAGAVIGDIMGPWRVVDPGFTLRFGLFGFVVWLVGSWSGSWSGWRAGSWACSPSQEWATRVPSVRSAPRGVIGPSGSSSGSWSGWWGSWSGLWSDLWAGSWSGSWSDLWAGSWSGSWSGSRSCSRTQRPGQLLSRSHSLPGAGALPSAS